MKNILVVTSTFPRYRDDPVAARFVYDLCKELAKFYRVYVLAPHDAQAKEYELIDNIEIYRFPYFYPKRYQQLCNGMGILVNLRQGGILAKLQGPFLFLGELCFLRKLVKEKKIDLINSHWMIPQGLNVAIIRCFYKIPHLMTIHAAGLFFLKRYPLGRWIASFIVQHTERIFTGGSYVKESLDALLGRNISAKIIPPGVHTSKFMVKEKKEIVRKRFSIDAKKVILYVGKLTEKKGVEFLIKAMKEVSLKITDVQLIIVGGGPLEKKLTNMTKELNLEKSIIFLGMMNHNQVINYYALSDVVVVPSIIDEHGETEGMPAVVVEAMSAGNPVVASNVSGIADVVKDGYNGFLTAPKNPQDIAKKIIEIFKTGKVKRMRKSALETAKKYDWEIIGKRYKKVIDELI